MPKNDIDKVTGIETTGHEWDGIRELNNPLPRWWLLTFYATILFSIGYIIYYPAIPLINSSTMGISGETNRAILKQEMAASRQAQQAQLVRIAAEELQSIKADQELNRFAIAGGASAFKVYCSQCHGSGAQGGAGYPNLNDDDWLWGGDLDSIYTSIKHGIRNDEDPDTRYSEMLAFGEDEILTADERNQVVEYVLKLSGREHESAMALEGESIFSDNCTACHGDKGTGDREQGAPNLVDAISLYGQSRDIMRAQINNPRHGVMPAWGGRLDDETLKQLTLYVHSLGGGE